MAVGDHVLYNCISCGWSDATIEEINEDSITVVHEGYEFQAKLEELQVVPTE